MNPMKYTYILKEETTFKDLIKELDAFGCGFLAIVDGDQKLTGILTDGDIRRAVLNSLTDIHEIINKNPTCFSASKSKRDAIKYLKSIHRKQLPLVDEENRLVEVLVLDDIQFATFPNKVVIMAGGLGSRLGELTESTPKPMLLVGNKPMLEHLIDGFVEHGFRNFILCVNHLSEVIEDHFGDGSQFGVNISYTKEKQKLGTAGALSLIEEKIDYPIFVVNADILTSVNFVHFLEFHENSNAAASMCIKEDSYQIPYATIKTDADGNVQEIEEKPLYKFSVNAGIYILGKEALNLVPQNEFYDMPTLLDDCMKKNMKVSGFQMSDYWMDIGRKDDYYRANEDIDK
jgi:dTDP-glucose pyrophosphorylase